MQSNILSSMTLLLKAVLVSLVIVLSLTSDSASSATLDSGFRMQDTGVQEVQVVQGTWNMKLGTWNALLSLQSFVGFVASGQKLPYLEYRRWTPLQVTLPSEYLLPWTCWGERWAICHKVVVNKRIFSHRVTEFSDLKVWVWRSERGRYKTTCETWVILVKITGTLRPSEFFRMLYASRRPSRYWLSRRWWS